MSNKSKNMSSIIISALAKFDIKIASDLLSQVNFKNNCQLINDSRTVNAGDIFCAVIGSEQDGKQYIDGAISNGAAMIIAQCQQTKNHGDISWTDNTERASHCQEQSIPVIQFYQLGYHLFDLAKVYYQNPQNQLTMIGVTGTNGKTSTSLLIAKLLEACQQSPAVIGTVGAGKLSTLVPITNTTPGATELHCYLANFVKNKVSHVAMEVSSHALSQRRVTANLIDIAVFTNLSRDHLDYHQTMENYAEAKRQLFTEDDKQFAILNGDDQQVITWLKNWPATKQLLVFGKSKNINQHHHYLQATQIKHHAKGVSFTAKACFDSAKSETEIHSPLLGDFNVDNLLAAMAVLLVDGFSLDKIAKAVTEITPIIGRMEAYQGNDLPTAIVDYAHTPDGLVNALQASRHHCTGELWLVFGCGGDRDKGKRALMGKAAEKLADHIIITNDNPRTEAPEAIAKDILAGCEKTDQITVQLERKKAVLTALKQAKSNDIVLLAGKGHEDYVIIGTEKQPYDERALVAEYYLAHSSNSNKSSESVS
jgi:UDP-N-acetylmuramoyl-L-alanyl-D-glutamate--2,6-diaminopimelate ligase